MDLSRYQHVVLFGGSFDPPHVAHVALPVLAMQAVGADAVAFIPAANAPHKRGRAQTPVHHRLAMLRLAVETSPRCVVLTDEIDRAANGTSGGASFTVDTLESLHARFPRVKMRLLIGADMLRIFDTWRSPERIVELAEPLVMVRPPDTRESLLDSLPRGYRRGEWEPRLLDLPRIDVSSTLIRGKVTKGEPITGLVAPTIEDYIRREALYVGS
jgi:nicotinate-nucleotide adenylyltransferase